MRPSKDEYYLGIAKAVSRRSTCLRRHYGAVIVAEDRIIATGYNGAPSGKPNCCDTGVCGRIGRKHNDGDYSTCPAIHAEANAIEFVRRYFGKSVARLYLAVSTLYLYGEEDGVAISAEPCPDCANIIQNAGISRVVGSKK